MVVARRAGSGRMAQSGRTDGSASAEPFCCTCAEIGGVICPPAPQMDPGRGALAAAGRAYYVARAPWRSQGLWRVMAFGCVSIAVLSAAALGILLALWLGLNDYANGAAVQSGIVMTWWYLALPLVVSFDMFGAAYDPGTSWKGERVYVVLALALIASQLGRVSHSMLAIGGKLSRLGEGSLSTLSYVLCGVTAAECAAAAVCCTLLCVLRDRGIGPMARKEELRRRYLQGLGPIPLSFLGRVFAVLARHQRLIRIVSVAIGLITVGISVFAFVQFVMAFLERSDSLTSADKQDAFREANSLYVYILLFQVLAPSFVAATVIMKKQALLKIVISAVSFITAAQTPVSVSRSVELAHWYSTGATTPVSTVSAAAFYAAPHRRLLQQAPADVDRYIRRLPLLLPVGVFSGSSAGANRAQLLSDCNTATAGIGNNYIQCESVHRTDPASELYPGNASPGSFCPTAAQCTEGYIVLQGSSTAEEADVNKVWNFYRTNGLPTETFGTVPFRSNALLETAAPSAEPTRPPSASPTRSPGAPSVSPTRAPTGPAQAPDWVNPFSDIEAESFVEPDTGAADQLDTSAAAAGTALGLVAVTAVATGATSAAEAVSTTATTVATEAATGGTFFDNTTETLLKQAQKGMKQGRRGEETTQGSFRLKQGAAAFNPGAGGTVPITMEGQGRDNYLVAGAMQDCLNTDATPDLALGAYAQVFMPPPDCGSPESEPSPRPPPNSEVETAPNQSQNIPNTSDLSRLRTGTGTTVRQGEWMASFVESPFFSDGIVDAADDDSAAGSRTSGSQGKAPRLMLHWVVPCCGVLQLAAGSAALAGFAPFWADYVSYLSSAAPCWSASPWRRPYWCQCRSPRSAATCSGARPSARTSARPSPAARTAARTVLIPLPQGACSR
eukprot:TRINITY_DN20369_c0_g1_i2.p1 TRINITY_DN20369_c0_g1~~TRINITY_DN20369_c0_g1_i2.p1  ORF type:complete len:900 (+),score=196.22 TRINITY_DN20369_c0_g1_i2:112-2811(+)